jgi:TRAP-type mannitol/chloroaromatic compound transport system permease large subunit
VGEYIETMSIQTPVPVISRASQRACQNEQAGSGSRTQPRRLIRLHPFSGLLIILLDNLFFGLNVATLGIGTLLACFLAFGATTVGVYLVQRFLDQDSRRASLAKAILSGALAGVPTSISGTIFGTAVLAASGLPKLGVGSLWSSRNRRANGGGNR